MWLHTCSVCPITDNHLLWLPINGTSFSRVANGIFSNQNSRFGKILEGLATEDVGIFYGHLVYFVVIVVIWNILWSFGVFCGHLVYFGAIWYILWLFGIFFQLWFVVWQTLSFRCCAAGSVPLLAQKNFRRIITFYEEEEAAHFHKRIQKEEEKTRDEKIPMGGI
jgi:hypothetical protein